MMRMPAVAIAIAFIASPDIADAQGKSKESPVAASRFGISIDGVQKPKAKGMKSSSGKKKGGSANNSKPVKAWPKKSY